MALPVDTCLVISFVIIGLLGVLINIFILNLISKNKEIRQQGYIIFIINRALVDFLYCLHLIIFQPLGVIYSINDQFWCQVASGINVTLVMLIILLEPLLAINRYISVCHKNFYPKIFKKRNIILMCGSFWILNILMIIPHVIDDSLGRVPGYYCAVKIEPRHLITIFVTDYIGVGMAYGIIIFCYYKIYSVLKKHQKQAANQNNQLSSKLQEDKSLLRFLIANAILPLATESPAVIASAIRMYDQTLINDYFLMTTVVLIIACPVINPAMTLFMVRPMRAEGLRIMNQILRRKPANTIQTINVSAAIPSNASNTTTVTRM